MTRAHSDLKAGSVPLIDPTSLNVGDNVSVETRPRIDGKTEIIPPSTPSNINPTINVSTGTEISTSTGSDSHPNEGSTLNQLLFDFESFLEGGDLDDVFGITPGSTSEGGKWEIAKLSGGLINVTVRVLPPHDDDKKPRSVVIKYAPPFMAAMGQDVPFGTFRQVGTILHSYHESPAVDIHTPLVDSPSTPSPYLRILTSEGWMLGYRIPGLGFAWVHTQHHICRGHVRGCDPKSPQVLPG